MSRFTPVVGLAAWLVLGPAAVLTADTRGIEIRPNEKGEFRYADDFQTARFLNEAFPNNLTADCWEKGAIHNCGPNRGRTVTYRFFGDRALSSIEIRIDQAANGPSLGGSNALYLSSNGLDWTLAATSGMQKPDANGWQREPLTVSREQTAPFLGRNEVWFRIVLDNSSGLKTGASSSVHALEVNLNVGPSAASQERSQSRQQPSWGELVRKAEWRRIALDWADPPDKRAPHYYEDSDGLLREPQDCGHLRLDEPEGFRICRTYLHEGRSPLALAAYVRTDAGALMARLVVRSAADSSRKTNVLWDGKVVATFDAATYFEKDQAFYVELPTGPAGVHELRVAGADSGSIWIRQIAVVAAGEVSWARKPALPPGGTIEILSSYFMPDPAPPLGSQAVEGRCGPDERVLGVRIEGLQRLYKEYAEFGAVRIAIRNSGTVPVRIKDSPLLNGKRIEDSYVDFTAAPWDARGVVWYRVRPCLLEPGQCGEAYIRFRRRPAGDRTVVAIPAENAGTVEVTVPYTDPGLRIDYVTTGRSGDRLYVYVRRTERLNDEQITALTLDGRSLENAKLYGPDFPGRTAFYVAPLPEPIREGTYHVVGIQTGHGNTIAAQFRVMPFVFPRSSIHVPPDLCKSMHMNLAMWNEQSLEVCEKYGVDTTSSSLLDLHRRVRYVMGPDEPDAHDNRGGGYGNGLGWNARRLAESGWQELIERYAPHAVSWIVMNGTTRPLNWWIYGQFADVSCFDPYPVTYYGADHAYVRESLSTARTAGAPKRMYACLEAYGWGKGQGVPHDSRGPTPAEYRQNVVQAIGAGMKGLTSWVYSPGAGGWELNKAVAEEIARMNALIECIEGELLLGTPADLATSDAGTVMTGTFDGQKWPKQRVWVGTLLSGPDAIVLTAANHIPACKTPPATIEPARNVTVTVRLPDFLRNVKAFEVTPKGLVPFPCTVNADTATLGLSELESGRVFVLRRGG